MKVNNYLLYKKLQKNLVQNITYSSTISIQCTECGFVLAKPSFSGIHLLFCTGKLFLADEVENKKSHLENAKVGSMWVLTKSSKPQECATASKSYATRPTHHHYGISALFSFFTDIVFAWFCFTFSPLNLKVYATGAAYHNLYCISALFFTKYMQLLN